MREDDEMYDFEMKVKVQSVYEITYEDVYVEYDQRDGDVTRKAVKSERFADWQKLRTFAYELKHKKILQVLEVHDKTEFLRGEMSTSGKD
jgi:hypothetical protein